MQFSEPRNKLTQRCFEHGFCFGTGQISIFTKIQWHTFEDWLLGKQPQVNAMLYQLCSNMCLHAVVGLSCLLDRFLWSSFRPSSTICFLTPPILAQSVSLQPISKLELTAPYFLRLVTLTVTDPFRPIGQWDIEQYTLDWDPGMLLMHLWLTFGIFHLHTSFMLWTWRKAMFGSQMSGHVNSTVAHRQMIEELFAQVVTWWWHQESKSSNQSSYRRRSTVVDILGHFLSPGVSAEYIWTTNNEVIVIHWTLVLPLNFYWIWMGFQILWIFEIMSASIASSSSAAYGSRLQARDAGFLTLPEAPLSADEDNGKCEHGGILQKLLANCGSFGELCFGSCFCFE